MRKCLALILMFLIASTAAIAESDLAGVPMEDLLHLRQDIDREIALRSQNDDTAQIVMADGLSFKYDGAVIGTGKDDQPAIAILFKVSNPTDSTKSWHDEVKITLTQGGEILGNTYFNAEGYDGPSVSDSGFMSLKPGATDIRICVAGLLRGDTDRIEVDLFKSRAMRNEEPYYGTFVVNLSDLKQGGADK